MYRGYWCNFWKCSTNFLINIVIFLFNDSGITEFGCFDLLSSSHSNGFPYKPSEQQKHRPLELLIWRKVQNWVVTARKPKLQLVLLDILCFSQRFFVCWNKMSQLIRERVKSGGLCNCDMGPFDVMNKAEVSIMYIRTNIHIIHIGFYIINGKPFVSWISLQIILIIYFYL